MTTTAYRTVTNFTATAGQTSFSVPSYTIGYIDVYRNGVRLVSTDYTATTGTTVVLNNACTVGDAVVTESFYVSSVLNAIPATAGSISLTSATYLTGQLPVANGGTGLSTVPHTVQVFTSGSGTYTTPANCKAISIRMVGGGGGGAGTGTSATAGTAGGSTTFGTAFLTCTGGAGGFVTGTNQAGGTATGGDINIAGATAPGAVGGVTNFTGGVGGSTPFGGAGAGGCANQTGSTAATNSGAGGGGGGGSTSTLTGGGGAAGAYLEKLISSPSATYAYAVGAAGTNGTGGTTNGGGGGSGLIIVTEYYV